MERKVDKSIPERDIEEFTSLCLFPYFALREILKS